MPKYDGEEQDKPADGVIDLTEDFRPHRYGSDTPPHVLDFQMPSHEELSENYQTVQTSASEVKPVIIPEQPLARWEPKKLNTQ